MRQYLGNVHTICHISLFVIPQVNRISQKMRYYTDTNNHRIFHIDNEIFSSFEEIGFVSYTF